MPMSVSMSARFFVYVVMIIPATLSMSSCYCHITCSVCFDITSFYRTTPFSFLTQYNVLARQMAAALIRVMRS